MKKDIPNITEFISTMNWAMVFKLMVLKACGRC
nr:MAG TPA: Photosystem II, TRANSMEMBRANE, ROOM TEMPERATURE, ELECTRON [Bacteriophage sp.]